MEKKALTYTLKIERHDDGYLAYFPALPGCHTWGKTYEAAVKHAEEALVGFLGRCGRTGKMFLLNAHRLRFPLDWSWSVRLHMLCDSPAAFVKGGSGSVAV